MSERKTRLTVTIDPAMAAYAERLVETGRADSVSAVVNRALAEQKQLDRRADELWREAEENADHARVARMLAYAEEQDSRLPASHR